VTAKKGNAAFATSRRLNACASCISCYNSVVASLRERAFQAARCRKSANLLMGGKNKDEACASVSQ